MNYIEEIINSQKDLKLISKNKTELIVKAKYGPSKETSIPLVLNEELSFFIATIIGDGHLRKGKEQITIELTNKKLIKIVQKVTRDLFSREFNIKSRIKNEKPTYYILMDSKAIYKLLNKVFEIPFGKKSHLIKIPKYIMKSNNKIKLAFLQGILVTEGGKRKRGFGMSTASKQLWEDLIKVFKEVGIKTLVDKWVHKKYKKEYYGLCFKKQELPIIFAGVPEWSNGRDLGVFFYQK